MVILDWFISTLACSSSWCCYHCHCLLLAEAKAKELVAANVGRVVQRFKSEHGMLPSQAQCEDIAGAGAAQALFYPSGKAPTEEISSRFKAIVSAECSTRLVPGES